MTAPDPKQSVEKLRTMPKKVTESKLKRFGYGFMVGLVLVLIYSAGTASGGNVVGGLLFALGLGLIIGLASMIFGDSFWRWAEKWLP